MTQHPTRRIPEGADPQLAGMLGPLLDHLTEPEAEPDWRLDTMPNAQDHQDELVDICRLMHDAGHHGPLRDTIPALIADAADLHEAYSAQLRISAHLSNQLGDARSELKDKTARLNASREHARMLDDRARWVFDRALSYCVTEFTAGDDD